MTLLNASDTTASSRLQIVMKFSSSSELNFPILSLVWFNQTTLSVRKFSLTEASGSVYTDMFFFRILL